MPPFTRRWRARLGGLLCLLGSGALFWAHADSPLEKYQLSAMILLFAAGVVFLCASDPGSLVERILLIVRSGTVPPQAPAPAQEAVSPTMATADVTKRIATVRLRASDGHGKLRVVALLVLIPVGVLLTIASVERLFDKRLNSVIRDLLFERHSYITENFDFPSPSEKDLRMLLHGVGTYKLVQKVGAKQNKYQEAMGGASTTLAESLRTILRDYDIEVQTAGDNDSLKIRAGRKRSIRIQNTYTCILRDFAGSQLSDALAWNPVDPIEKSVLALYLGFYGRMALARSAEGTDSVYTVSARICLRASQGLHGNISSVENALGVLEVYEANKLYDGNRMGPNIQEVLAHYERADTHYERAIRLAETATARTRYSNNRGDLYLQVINKVIKPAFITASRTIVKERGHRVRAKPRIPIMPRDFQAIGRTPGKHLGEALGYIDAAIELSPLQYIPWATRGQAYSLVAFFSSDIHRSHTDLNPLYNELNVLRGSPVDSLRNIAFEWALDDFATAARLGFPAAKYFGPELSSSGQVLLSGKDNRAKWGLDAFDLSENRTYLRALRDSLDIEE